MAGWQIWQSGLNSLPYGWVIKFLSNIPLFIVCFGFFAVGVLMLIASDVKRHSGILKYVFALVVLIVGYKNSERIKALAKAHNEEMEELEKKYKNADLKKKFERPKNWLDL